MARKKEVILYLIFVLVFYLMNYLTPLYMDDYSYMFSMYDGEKINCIWDIFPSQYVHYFTVNSRVEMHFFVQLFLLMGKNVFNVINTAAMSLLVYVLGFIATGSNPKCKHICIIVIMLFLFTPYFGESFLWLDASATYLYGPLIGSLYFLLVLMLRKKIIFSKKINIILAVITLLCGFIAGATNENGSAVVIILSALLIVENGRKISLRMFCGTLGAILGAVFLLVSPGEKARMAQVGGLSGVQIITNIYNITLSIFEYFGLIIFLIVLVCLWIIIKKSWLYFYTEYKRTVFSFIGFLTGAYSMILAPGFPGRAWSIPFICLIITCVNILNNIKNEKDIFKIDYLLIDKWMHRGIRITGLLISAIIIYAFIDLLSVYNCYISRNEYILDQIEKGEEKIRIPAIAGKTTYSCFGLSGDIEFGRCVWPNRDMAHFYSVEEIIRDDDIVINIE